MYRLWVQALLLPREGEFRFMSASERQAKTQQHEEERARRLRLQAPPSRRVPNAIAGAMASGRGMLCEITAKQVLNGEVTLTKEDQAELIRLLGDFVDHHHDLNVYREEMKRELLATERSVEGAFRRLIDIVAPETDAMAEDDE